MRALLFLTSLQAVCRCIPAAQAVDFLTAILDSLLHVKPPRARAVRKWAFIFLVECRKEIVQEVKERFFSIRLCLFSCWLLHYTLCSWHGLKKCCLCAEPPQGLLRVRVVH